MSPSCTPRRSWRRRRRCRAFSNSYNLLLCALPCPACTPGRKKEKNVTRELDSNCPPAPFSPYALNFLFFSFPYVFLFFSFPLPCSFLDLSEEIRRRRDARNSAMSNISKREWKVGCPKIYSKSMIESCLWYHLAWQVDPLFALLTLIEVINNLMIFLVPTQIF